MIKPPVLRHGDRVAALSLSWGGPSIFPDRYKAGKRQMEQCLGVKLVEGRHTMADATWLAAHLMEAFADPSIRGIVSTIGGDDSIRLFPFLDLALIRNNPNPFWVIPTQP
jgi:muramoyltetrapeptide carboxypeptidase LdcA involved in peptidoglycan recycling